MKHTNTNKFKNTSKQFNKASQFIKRLSNFFSNNGIAISILVVIFLFFISVGYSALATSFLVSGDAHLRVKADIRITGIKMIGSSNSGYETYNSEYYKNGTKIFTTLPNINSTVTYQVEVTNTSDDVYILKEINELLYSNENIEYVIENIKEKDEIAANSKITFNIIVKYKEGVTKVPSNNLSVVELNYVFEIPDKTPPAVMFSLQEGLYAENKTVTVTAIDEHFDYMDIEVYLNGQKVKSKSENGLITDKLDVKLDSQGEWEIRVKAYDLAGNIQNTLPLKDGWTYRNYMIDTTIPTVTITATKKVSGTVVGNGIESNEMLNFKLTEEIVGPSGAEIYYCKDTTNTCNPTTIVESGADITSYNTVAGTYYIRYKIISVAGLSSTVESYKAVVNIPYTVTFNANGGTVSPTNKIVIYGETYGSLPAPGKAGYIFAGWYTASGVGTQITSTTKVQITADQTLYAHWTQCEAGTYAEAGATSCSACPNGYTSDAGATAQNKCYIKVSAGKYIGTVNSATQTSCAAGTSKAAHTVYYGGTSSCSQCTAGTYSTAGAGSCSTCPSGYTSDAGATAQNKCYIKVSAGKYIGTANSATQSTCAAGKYKAAHTVYYGSTSSCSTCGAGTYSTGGAGSCTTCPSGYTSDAGATAQNKCYIKVSAGKYIGTANSATQTSCAAGTSKGAHTVYYGSTSSCSTCAAGTYSTGGAESCTTCPSGYTSAAGATAQNKCYISVSAGKYIGTANSATQSTCAAGKYKTAHTVYYGNTSSCDTCPTGYTSAAGATAQNKCYISVSAGKYIGTVNSATQTNCAAGKYKTAHTVYYGGTSSCDTCPSGYTSAAGATAQNKCYISVSAGKYIGTANSATQTNCAAGKYKAAHTVYYGSTSSCSTCAAGTYSTGGAGSCTTCPSGQTSDAGASSCHSTCTWAFRHDSGRSGFSTTCDVSNTASYCDSSTSGKAKKESCSSGYYGQKGVTHGGGAYSSLSACENKYGTGGCQSGNYLSIAVCTCE